MARVAQLVIGLVLIIGFALVRDTKAACPSPGSYYWPGTSTLQTIIRLVGHTNNVPDPHGACTMVLRDAGGFVVPNVPVTIEFPNCPDIRISRNQDPNTEVICTPLIKRVTQYTNAAGQVTFTLIGKAINTGGSPGSVGSCAKLYICGDFVWNMKIAAYDQDGVNGVTLLDVSLVYSDANSGQNPARSDFDNDGDVDNLDVSSAYAIVNAHQSQSSGTNWCE